MSTGMSRYVGGCGDQGFVLSPQRRWRVANSGGTCKQDRTARGRFCTVLSLEDDKRFPLEVNLRWRDRVAVFAQICPEKTLDALLEALQENVKHGPRKDEGLEALYTFANFSVWQVSNNFFGRKMDLGQFERFRRVMITKPYDIIINHERREVLSAVRVGNGQYHSRIRFLGRSGPLVFHFAMSRTTLGKFETWMVDSVLPAPDEESNQSV